jgi:hypothetical protein
MNADEYAKLLFRLQDHRLFTVADLEAYFNEKNIPVLARLVPEEGSIQLICFDRDRIEVEAIRRYVPLGTLVDVRSVPMRLGYRSLKESLKFKATEEGFL